MRTSFHTATLHELPIVEAVQQLLDAGYDAVELNAEALPWAGPHVGPETPSEIREQLKATGAISSIAAHRSGLASPKDDERREAIDWTLGCVQLAADVGADVVHVIPGDQPDVGNGLGVVSEPGDLPSFISALNEVVKGAEGSGVKVALEPIVNQLISTTDEALEVLERVPGLKISFDPSHLHVTTHDVDDAARRLGQHVVIAAIKDAKGNPDDFAFLAQGDGEIDFASMVRVLREQGFDGALVVEHEAHLFGDERGPDAVVRDSLVGAKKLVELL